MRKLLIIAWLLLPAAGLAYHYGPGQERWLLDEIDAVLLAARAHEARGEWPEAVAKYGQALERLPAGLRGEIRRVLLARARAQMLAAQLPEANRSLADLLEEVSGDPKAEPGFVAEVRSALAGSQYYMTWLKRLEGAPREEWLPYSDEARQNYRLLADAAQKRADPADAAKRKEDLEASIRLARMELSELQGLPLPSQ